MSLSAAYLLPGRDEPADGEEVSTALGWQRWADWVLTHADHYPEASHLAQEGWLEGGAALAELEEELTRLLHEAPDPDRAAVTAQVLAALRARPDGSAALLVTDGDGGGDESEVAEAAGPHEFAAVMAPLTGEAAEAVLSLGRAVADSDLADDGREDEVHVTVRYGLHAESVDEVAPLLRGERPVRMTLTTVSVFPDSGKGFDVLKADVESEDLVAIHEKLGSLPHTDTHPEYHPHATIARVRPGLGAKYAARFGRLDVECVTHKLHFGGRSGGARGTLPLDGVAESDLVDELVTVRRHDGTTYQQHRKVRRDDPGGGTPPAGRGDWPDHPAAHGIRSAVEASDLPAEKKAEYSNAVASVLSRMPPRALDRVAAHSTRVVFHPDAKSLGLAVMDRELAKEGRPAAEVEWLKEMRDGIAAGKYQVAGAYQTNSREVHLDGGQPPGRQQAGPHGGRGDPAEVHAHELGHAIDGPDSQVSRSKRWLEAYHAEIGPRAGAEPRLTRYAHTNASEGLAEFARLVYGGRADLARVEAEFPVAVKFFKDAKLWPES